MKSELKPTDWQGRTVHLGSGTPPRIAPEGYEWRYISFADDNAHIHWLKETGRIVWDRRKARLQPRTGADATANADAHAKQLSMLGYGDYD